MIDEEYDCIWVCVVSCAVDGPVLNDELMMMYEMMKRAIYICDIYRGIGYTLALT